MRIPLWRRRINFTTFFIYDLLHSRIDSNKLRDRINYTSNCNMIQTKEVLRFRVLIGIDMNRNDYAHNQPFNTACQNFNKLESQFLQSALRNNI